MGTSTARPQLEGNRWAKAAESYRRWQADGSLAVGAATPAAALRDALHEQVAEDSEAFGLNHAMNGAGERLVDEVQRLRRDGIPALADAKPAERRTVFVAEIVGRVAGHGGTFADAAVRKSAVELAERLLADDRVRQAVESGSTGGLPISDSLFCWIYRLFFADTVKQFLTTAIAEHTTLILTVHFPMLPIIDPQGVIGTWLAQNIVAVLPDPCRESGSNTGPSTAELGRSLLKETVDRALGIPADGSGS
jgi:hypothetical protein